MAERSSLSRRTLLKGGAATLLGGCTVDRAPARAPTPGVEPAASPPGPSPFGAAPRTVDELLAGRFLVAHRGSGDNWPEHTLAAYLHAARAGADAIEISVRATADGTLVCHHDADTRRVTGVEGAVAETNWAVLAERRVDARRWLGGATRLEPISTLDEVLTALPSDCLVFIEDKDGTNTGALLDMMDAQPRSTDRFVWKQWAPAKQVSVARKRGYRTWGYFTSDILDRLDEVASEHDALGIPVQASDLDIERFVATGKPVIPWEVHTRYERDRLLALGVAGLMCSNVPYVLEGNDPSTSDAFATGRRAPGDLPANYGDGWGSQPALEPGVEAVTLRGDASPRYLLGSLCPIALQKYRVDFTVGWEGPPAGRHSRAGIAFCLEDDGPYHPRQANRSGSYQAFLNSDGRVALAYQSAGWTASENLATIERSLSEPARISVAVEQQKMTLVVDRQTAAVNHMNTRGGYLWLWGEQLSTGARFSDVRVTRL